MYGLPDIQEKMEMFVSVYQNILEVDDNPQQDAIEAVWIRFYISFLLDKQIWQKEVIDAN